MKKLLIFSKILFLITLILCCRISFFAQEPANSPPPVVSNEDEILKIDTNLIQTGVSVTNKSGEFIDGLNQADFEVSIDGKPVTIKFFDKVIERKQNSSTSAKNKIENNTAIVERGRTLIFLVDDVHLGIESTIRTKRLIEKFISEEMLDEDLVAIISSSGKIGFLQQFTNDKVVLRAAIERLRYNRNFSGNGDDPPPMSENEALEIDRLDTDTINRFVSNTMKINPGMRPDVARSLVLFRAQSVLAFARTVTKNTFSLLEESMNKTRVLPGRKVVFFISDGFLLDPGNTNAVGQLNKITNAATRSNTVIYSFDARGLDAGEPNLATIMDSSGFTTSGLSRFERQDGLSHLAYKTGGQFIRNTNDLQSNLTKAAAEAFTYYLLAWEPEIEEGKSEKLKNIEISVKGRPELKVRVNSGYLSEAPKPAEIVPVKQISDEQKLIATTNSLIPKREIPVALAANYLDTSGGGILSATIQIDTNFVEFTKEGSAAKAELEIVGLIYNSEGKREKNFKVPLKINAESLRLTKSGNPPFYYEYQTNLKPDLYQMRVAIRDVKSGRIGNSSQWLEIHDLSSRKLEMSSLLIGERKKNEVVEKTAASGKVQPSLQLNVDRYFDNTSTLRFFGFIYNVATAEKPDLSNLAIQAEILKQGKILLTNKVNLLDFKERDLTRLIYGGEIPLHTLPLGRYELKVTVRNSGAKTAKTKSVNFLVK